VVDPISNEDRGRTLWWAKIGTVALVGLSAGLIAIQGDASLELVGGAVLAGSLVGIALVWYLFPDLDAIAPATGRR
jgi:hypothetical protein